MRNKRSNFLTKIGYFILFFLLAGCQLFQPITDRSRIFEIGLTLPEHKVTATDQGTLRVSIGHFPEVLERPYLVVKVGGHELKELINCRWASGLRSAILHALVKELRYDFPDLRVYEFPKESVRSFDGDLRVDIERLEINPKERRVIFAGDWRYRNEQEHMEDGSHFEFYELWEPNKEQYEAAVAAVERVIKACSETLNQQLSFLLLKEKHLQKKEESSGTESTTSDDDL